MNARKFKAVVHLGTNASATDMPDDVWVSLINTTLGNASLPTGVQLELQPKEWEPPGGLVRKPNKYSRSRRRR